MKSNLFLGLLMEFAALLGLYVQFYGRPVPYPQGWILIIMFGIVGFLGFLFLASELPGVQNDHEK
jgi:pilus assembly protein TadC